MFKLYVIAHLFGIIMVLENWKLEFVQANGIRIHYVTAGEGPLVVLLHGFPEFWYAWRHQIPALAKKFQVVAPDLRGYGETERPPNVSDYQGHLLVGDVAGLIHALGHEKAHIIGHDWGGGIAWKTALSQPEVINRLVILNCPHPYILAKALRSNFKQIRKSWYIFFFQLPFLPEILFNLNLKKTLTNLFRGSAIRQDTFTDEDIETYYQALKPPGALSAALNYYRAAFRIVPKESTTRQISAPTLLIWGENDTALGKELTYDMESLFKGPFQIRYVPNCSHWVNEEKPEVVNRMILDFLA